MYLNNIKNHRQSWESRQTDGDEEEEGLWIKEGGARKETCTLSVTCYFYLKYEGSGNN